MGFIERRNGKYRVRYRDPLGNQRCRTFTRKADAERFVREMEVDVERFEVSEEVTRVGLAISSPSPLV